MATYMYFNFDNFKEKYIKYFYNNPKYINPLKTSPEYTRAGVYGKCML